MWTWNSIKKHFWIYGIISTPWSGITLNLNFSFCTSTELFLLFLGLARQHTSGYIAMLLWVAVIYLSIYILFYLGQYPLYHQLPFSNWMCLPPNKIPSTSKFIWVKIPVSWQTRFYEHLWIMPSGVGVSRAHKSPGPPFRGKEAFPHTPILPFVSSAKTSQAPDSHRSRAWFTIRHVSPPKIRVFFDCT